MRPPCAAGQMPGRTASRYASRAKDAAPPARSSLHLRLRVESPTHDVVLGNPPWGVTLHDAPEGTFRGKRVDSFKLFLDLGTKCARASLGMIVPQAVLMQETHADIRAVLLSHLRPHAVMSL